jgi:hypothetical protein
VHKRARPGESAKESHRLLQIFDVLADTELVIDDRHSEEPEERNIFDKAINSSPSQAPISGINSLVPTSVTSTEDSDDDVISSLSPSAAPPSDGDLPTSPTDPTLSTDSPSPSFGNSTASPTVGNASPTFAPSVAGSDATIVSPSPSSAASSSPGPNSTDALSLQEFVEGKVDDVELLRTDGTPQNLALSALANSNPELDTGDPDDQIQILQRYALNTLYYSCDGDQWKNNNLWTESSPLCGEDMESSWHGVVCEKSGTQIVERLSLAGNDLVGQIPSEIAFLISLSKCMGSSKM